MTNKEFQLAVKDAEELAGRHWDQRGTEGSWYLYQSLVALSGTFPARTCDLCGDQGGMVTHGLCRICATAQYAG